jgi:amidase
MATKQGQKKDWKAIAAQKQQERQDRLPTRWLIQDEDLPSKDVFDVTQFIAENKWLNEEELAITGLSVIDLAAAIKERQYTALAVVEAYAHRATIAQQLVNPYVLTSVERLSC